MSNEFIALIGDERIPTSAKVIAAYIKTQGSVPFVFIPAPGQKIDDEADEVNGADWTQK